MAIRTAILHADDVGMCHGANAAFVELSRQGRLTCGSVMVPCPWFPEVAAIAADDVSLDLGVHLTLTSEWPQYRWRPLTCPTASAHLVDEHGFFHRNVAALLDEVEPDACETEMRAQLDRAIDEGIDVTHIDTHMGAALTSPLIDAYCRIGRDYRLPVMLPRRNAYLAQVLKLDAYTVTSLWDDAIAQLTSSGQPLVDDFRMTPGVAHEQSVDAYRSLIDTLPEGLTFIALHPNKSGDIETIVPPRAHFRTDEYELLSSGQITEWLDTAGVQTVGMRELRDQLRNNN